MAKLTNVRERVHAPFWDTLIGSFRPAWFVVSVNDEWFIEEQNVTFERKGPYASAEEAKRALALEVLGAGP